MRRENKIRIYKVGDYWYAKLFRSGVMRLGLPSSTPEGAYRAFMIYWTQYDKSLF